MPHLACWSCGRQIYTVSPLESLFAEERRCPRCGTNLDRSGGSTSGASRSGARRPRAPGDPGPGAARGGSAPGAPAPEPGRRVEPDRGLDRPLVERPLGARRGQATAAPASRPARRCRPYATRHEAAHLEEGQRAEDRGDRLARRPGQLVDRRGAPGEGRDERPLHEAELHVRPPPAARRVVPSEPEVLDEVGDRRHDLGHALVARAGTPGSRPRSARRSGRARGSTRDPARAPSWP